MAKEKNDGGQRRNLWKALFWFVILCPASLYGTLWLLDSSLEDAGAVSTEAVVEVSGTMSADDLVLVMLERDVPLVDISDVVVTDYVEPAIIGVTIDMIGDNNVDLTLFQMQDIVCALKDARWEGYRYRIAARIATGPAGIIMAIEPDVVAQIDCDGSSAIIWENATSEYFIMDGLQ